MAISFNGLGNAGRLGNQMFQYASIRGIAANRGFDWMIPPANADRCDNYGLFDAFKLINCKEKNQGEQSKKTISWREFHFNKDIFDKIDDEIDLDGYFQSEKYFKNIENEIRQDFTFKDEWLEPCKEYIDSIGNKKLAFLHVRRGNPNLQGVRGERWSYQLLQQYHPLCKFEYYEEALKEFDDSYQVLVFSDVIDWCKEQPFFKGDRFLFSDNSKELFNDGASVPYVDLCLMSLCSDAIIANSSLSWWGAWLINNPNKKVIAPKPWFGSAYSNYIMDDLIPEGWIEKYNDPKEVPPEV